MLKPDLSICPVIKFHIWTPQLTKRPVQTTRGRERTQQQTWPHWSWDWRTGLVLSVQSQTDIPTDVPTSTLLPSPWM